MLRTKKPYHHREPLAILTADLHLRETQPPCRTDDIIDTQIRKLKWLTDLQLKYDCPVICAGDVLHHWKPSPYLLSLLIQYLPDRFYTVYGNHDLPQNTLELRNKSGIYCLEQARRLCVLPGTHYGEPLTKASLSFSPRGSHQTYQMAVWHTMTWLTDTPYPGCKDPDAYKLLRKYPEYDLILTGHNHKPFVAQKDGRFLVNPGSISRQEADQTEYEPRVYLWYGDAVEPVYVPIEPGVMTRDHLDRVTERNDRIEAFISRLDGEWDAGVSFEENLERFFATNEIRDSVKQIIYKALES